MSESMMPVEEPGFGMRPLSDDVAWEEASRQMPGTQPDAVELAQQELLRLQEQWAELFAPAPASADPDRAAQALPADTHGGMGEQPLLIAPFLERLRRLRELGFDLTDPRVGVVLSPDEASAFCLGHDVEADEARRLAAGEITFPELVRRGWLARVGDFVGQLVPRGRRLPAEAVLTPIAEIHCPHVEGCEASYTRSRMAQQSIRLNVTLRGIAAGGGVATSRTLERKITTAAACKRISVQALVSALDWWHPLFPGRTLRIYDVQALDWYTTEEILGAGEGHDCGPHFEKEKALLDAALLHDWLPQGDCRVHEPAAGTGSTEESVEVTRERSFRFTVGNVEVESRFARVVKYAYTLADGHGRGYVGRFPDDHSGAFQWVWRE